MITKKFGRSFDDFFDLFITENDEGDQDFLNVPGGLAVSLVNSIQTNQEMKNFLELMNELGQNFWLGFDSYERGRIEDAIDEMVERVGIKGQLLPIKHLQFSKKFQVTKMTRALSGSIYQPHVTEPKKFSLAIGNILLGKIKRAVTEDFEELIEEEAKFPSGGEGSSAGQEPLATEKDLPLTILDVEFETGARGGGRGARSKTFKIMFRTSDGNEGEAVATRGDAFIESVLVDNPHNSSADRGFVGKRRIGKIMAVISRLGRKRFD